MTLNHALTISGRPPSRAGYPWPWLAENIVEPTLITTLNEVRFKNPHSTGEKTEAQRGTETIPGSHSMKVLRREGRLRQRGHASPTPAAAKPNPSELQLLPAPCQQKENHFPFLASLCRPRETGKEETCLSAQGCRFGLPVLRLLLFETCFPGDRAMQV